MDRCRRRYTTGLAHFNASKGQVGREFVCRLANGGILGGSTQALGHVLPDARVEVVGGQDIVLVLVPDLLPGVAEEEVHQGARGYEPQCPSDAQSTVVPRDLEQIQVVRDVRSGCLQARLTGGAASFDFIGAPTSIGHVGGQRPSGNRTEASTARTVAGS